MTTADAARPDMAGKRLVIAGTNNVIRIENILRRKGAVSDDVVIVPERGGALQTHNVYKSRLLWSNGDYGSLTAKARLMRKVGKNPHNAVAVWDDEKRFTENIVQLFFARLIAGARTEVLAFGEFYSVTPFLRLYIKRRLREVDLAGVALYLAVTALRMIYAMAGGSVSAARFPLRFMLCRGDEKTMAWFTQVTCAYLEMEDAIRSGARLKRARAYVSIAGWAAASAVTAVVLVPYLRAARWLKSGGIKKRVLFISHESTLNGAPVSLLNIIGALDRDEYEPALLTVSEGLLTKKARSMGVPVYVLPLSRMLNQHPVKMWYQAARFIVSAPYVMYLTAWLGIDITHTNVIVTPDGAVAAKALGAKSVWHFREWLRPDWWSRLQARVMSAFSDAVICNSHHSKKTLAGRGAPPGKLEVAHNALDPSFIAPGGGRKFRESMGAGPGHVLVGCVARVAQTKGQETFVKAAVEVARRHYNVTFAVVGTLQNKPYVAKLRKIIAENGMEKRIVLTGYRTDIPEIMAGLDIHVSPSIWEEPFGRGALEGMAMGAVSVVSGIGGLVEIVEDGKSGVVVPPGDEKALERAIESLIEDGERTEAIRREGVRRARRSFSTRKHIDTVQGIYRAVFSNQRVSPSAMWRRMAPRLPERTRSCPKALFAYVLMAPFIAALWLAALPLFLVLLPLAMAVGAVGRKLGRDKKTLAIAYQTTRAASTRYRIEKTLGGAVTIDYPSSRRLADRVYDSLFYGFGRPRRDAYYYSVVFLNRLKSILKSYSYGAVIIQYEMFHEGPMWMERLLAATHPRVIYDIDDSLQAFPRYARELPKLMRDVSLVIAGNRLMMEYSKEFNPNVVVVPTCPDHAMFTNTRSGERDERNKSTVTIGWVGNPANLGYLKMIARPLERLSRTHDIDFKIVCSGPYRLEWYGLENVPVTRKEWRLDREAEDIVSFDIGVMPVRDDLVGRGKCGFKALQYMAAGVPCVISPVGMNAEIIEDGVNGFLAGGEDEWYESLKSLAESTELRRRLGEAGREYTLERYNLGRWAEVWRGVLDESVLRAARL